MFFVIQSEHACASHPFTTSLHSLILRWPLERWWASCRCWRPTSHWSEEVCKRMCLCWGCEEEISTWANWHSVIRGLKTVKKSRSEWFWSLKSEKFPHTRFACVYVIHVSLHYRHRLHDFISTLDKAIFPDCTMQFLEKNNTKSRLNNDISRLSSNLIKIHEFSKWGDAPQQWIHYISPKGVRKCES